MVGVRLVIVLSCLLQTDVLIWFLEPPFDFDFAILCELDSVGQEVHCHLLDPLLVCDNHALRYIVFKHNILAGSLHLDDSCDFFDDCS